ncbi:MAG: addiction module protein [Thermoleophilia bacterium]
MNVQVTARRPIIDIEYLSVDERILLAQDLWDSIRPDSPELALTPSMEALLEERLAEHARNPDAGEPWEDVLERLRQRLREGRSDVDA